MQNRGMIYGYVRVSTDAQDLTSQLAQLRSAGCEKVFREKITGATADRPQLKKLIAALTYGDVVVIPAVDRLSRDTTDLLVIAREMQRACARWLSRSSIPRRSSPNWCLPCSVLPRSWKGAALPNARHGAGPMPDRGA